MSSRERTVVVKLFILCGEGGEYVGMFWREHLFTASDASIPVQFKYQGLGTYASPVEIVQKSH